MSWRLVVLVPVVAAVVHLVGCGEAERTAPAADAGAAATSAPVRPAVAGLAPLPSLPAFGLVSQPPPAAPAEPAPGPGAEGQAFREGCQARSFILLADGWITRDLPPAPAEVVTLAAFPAQVPAARGNVLLPRSGFLRDLDYYAVEFTGFIYAEEDGLYTFAVRSDDPYELLVEDTRVLRSAFAFDVQAALQTQPGGLVVLKMAKHSQRTNTTQGSIELTGGRYYPITVRCRQQHVIPSSRTKVSEDAGAAMGAELCVTLSTPSGDSGLLRTYVRRPPASGAR